MMNNSRIYINNQWNYLENFSNKIFESKYKCEEVCLPHSFAITPLNYFDESCYQKTSGYRRIIKTEKDWKDKRVFVTFEGAAHEAFVYLNGKLLGKHSSGYTAFTIELTNELLPVGKNNVLVVKLDSHESLDFPPFGYVIDFMTYGGIYRDVYLEVKDSTFIEDVFVTTKSNALEANVVLNENKALKGRAELFPYICNENKLTTDVVRGAKSSPKNVGSKSSSELSTGRALKPLVAQDFDFTENGKAKINLLCPIAKFWSPEEPTLYVLKISLVDEKSKKNESKGKAIDEYSVRFGFRDIEMRSDGFYLNGKKYKIRGLNRHQSYPYVGYAMPRSMQEFDADILKKELGVNAVRTSHYPQSQYFISRCDEIGLLVFTEMPGWQHIGQSDAWRKQVLQNVTEMITQYRNHPSIFMWGVRVNESCDDDELYIATNKVAHALDSSRPTGGVRCITKSHLFEDVYTYNDFIHSGNNMGCQKKKNVTSNMEKAYLISEYGGHMYPTKEYDDEIHRTSHALRHATVLSAVAAEEDIAGSFGWCAFDYNTHKDFGSGDRICYHGVMDMYRNPKNASGVYLSQQEKEDVLVISSSMDIGEHPEGLRGKNYIFTNADSVKMYLNDEFIHEYKTLKKNGIAEPILIDDYVGNRLEKGENLKPSIANKISCLLNYVALHGQEKMPFPVLVKAASVLLQGTSYAKIRKYYDLYVGNWGGKAAVYKFEAIKNGKVVKTVVKGAVKETELAVNLSANELVEGNSYDVIEARLSMIDQYSNVLPYFTEPVTFKTTGPIEILGPSETCFRAGMAACYIKSCGKSGKASLLIKCGDNQKLISLRVVKKS